MSWPRRAAQNNPQRRTEATSAFDPTRPHTVVVIDRRISAGTLDEISRKLHQPVIAFGSATRVDDGEWIVDSAAMNEEERAAIAYTLHVLRESVRVPLDPPREAKKVIRGQIDELAVALAQLRHAVDELPDDRDPSADEYATARWEGDSVHQLAEEVASTLTSCEMEEDERERKREAWERERQAERESRRKDKPPKD